MRAASMMVGISPEYGRDTCFGNVRDAGWARGAPIAFRAP